MLLARDEERLGILGLPPAAGAEIDLSWFDESGVGDLSSEGRILLFGDRNGVYLRRTDGAPAVRLGEGFADALSPDGRWALATSSDARELVLLPTAPGVPRTLPRHTIESYAGALWHPNGKSVLFNGSVAGRGLRGYVQEWVRPGPRRWPSAPGDSRRRVGLVAVPRRKARRRDRNRKGVLLQPLDGGPARAVPGSEPGDLPVGWTKDARTLWVFRRSQVPAPVYQLDVESGRRTLWKHLVPADAAGVLSISAFRITADGASYTYTFRRVRSDLYLATGLR